MESTTSEDGTPKLLPKFWKESSSLTDQQVLEHIKHLNKRGDSQQSGDDVDHGTWESPPNPLCAASFGDNGMTATVNAYGLLMQFGDYLGIGRSGLFTADHDYVDEPWYVVSRADDLDEMTKAPSLRQESYGLSLGGSQLSLKPEQRPRLSWKQWRWPSYKYDREQFYDSSSSLTIDWMVHKKVLLQRCVLDNGANDDVEIAIRFLKGLRIRDLDHMAGKEGLGFNDKDNTRLEGGPGPGRCSWIWRAPYPSSKTVQRVVGEEDIEPETPAAIGKPKSVEESVDLDSTAEPSDARRHPIEIRLGYFQHEGVQPPKISITEATNKQDPDDLPDENGENTKETTNDPRFVVVVAAVFVNGVPRQFESEQSWSSPQTWIEELRKGAQDAPDVTRRLEIITAYRMLLQTPSDVAWKDLVIKADEIDMDCFMKENSLRPEYLPSISGHISVPPSPPNKMDYETNLHKDQRVVKEGINKSGDDQEPEAAMSPTQVKHLLGMPQPSSSPSDHIEYLIWRNLEHILSVCSVPVGPKRDGEIQPIALTCGDLSMHRVCTSASFFAIRFLMEVSKRLKNSSHNSKGVENLQDRIKTVCVGHIHWLMSADKSESGVFAANYWVTGKIYPHADDSFSWQASEGVVNTPFQILKAAEVLSFYSLDQTARNISESFLRHIRDPWLQRLHEMDQRMKFAWPHAIEEGINTFRLDDHVWIWRACKALHDLNLWERWSHSSDKRQSSLTDIQREILQRFTMRNDDSGKRMLAVTRSVREHRFLFHARDTALFYGLDFFLQNTSSRELWESTIQAQAQHEDNQEMTWDNAIRYALAIVMGTHDSRVNPSKTVPEHVQGAVQSLLGITSPNGFFPGQLGESSDGEPVPYLFYEEEYRDFYFHAHFEISFVLLLNFDSISRQCTEKTPRLKENRTQQDLSPKELSRLGHSVENQLENISNDLKSLTESILMQQDHKKSSEKHDRKTVIAMKKIFPFGSSVDSSKIVEIDEEWLFNYPAFLGKQQSPLPDYNEIGTAIEKARKEKASGDVIFQQLETYADESRRFGVEKPACWIVAVMDVPKRKHIGKMKNRQRDIHPRILRSKKDLWDVLKRQRKAEDAKKRLVWLHIPDAETAVVCYLTTPPAHQAPLSLFFDRHTKKVTHFSDETSKVHNEWKTELLFSFYVLSTNSTTTAQLPESASSSDKTFPMVQGAKPVRACLGFRFEGDVFDRYWTCHFIDWASDQPDPEPKRFQEWSYADTVLFYQQSGEIESTLQSERDWRQRKVLELLFLGRMVDILLQSTGPVIDKLKAELEHGTESYAQLSSEKYLADTHVRFKGWQNLLESMEASLSSILDVLNKWDARERDRAQQPRWTRNDERKYRESINNLRGSLERKSADLKALQFDVRSLKEKFIFTITTNMAKISENRSTSKEENLRLFTYVTVVFLPLGFAASIFSMAGTPDTPLLVDMITCAIIALILTVIMLLNAKSLAGMARETSRSIHKYSLRKMDKSQLARYLTTKRTQSGTANHKRVLKTEDDEKSWYILFWVVYILVEFPARRVLVACRVLVSFNYGKHDTESETPQIELPQTSGPTGEQAHKEVSRSPGKAGASSPISIARSTIRVLGGLVFSPLFVTSWILQLVICNAWDLLRLIHGAFPSSTSSSSATTKDLHDTYPDVWFKPSKWWRPIRELNQRVTHNRDSKVDGTKPRDGEVPAKDESSEKPEVSEESKGE